MSCDVGEVTERLENEQSYVTTHSPTLPLLHLHHSSFPNLSVASPMSQLILQPFRCFAYVTAHSPTHLLLLQRHSSFSNPSFASLTSQALHLRYLASCSWIVYMPPCYLLHNRFFFLKAMFHFSILNYILSCRELKTNSKYICVNMVSCRAGIGNHVLNVASR